MKTGKTTAIKSQSLSFDDYATKPQLCNSYNYAKKPREESLENLDNTQFDLERIMFEEFAHGLPSDIPMADL
ncbi:MULTISPECIES: hypothetical protein [unclassified Anabaena]|uniref:hypothetical protein n=1 Tax=unclassified Anabaena TaxID=2619674 RepID=UPI0039C6C675